MNIYPVDKSLPDGSKYPGMDPVTKKFTGGDAQQGIKASALPAETINLILDNLESLILAGMEEADNTNSDQLKDSVLKLINNHTKLKDNPHSVTKAQVGLGSVPNWVGDTSILLGDSNTKFASQKAIKAYVDKVALAVKNEVWPIGIDYTQKPGLKSPVELGLPGDWRESDVMAGDFPRYGGTAGNGVTAKAFGTGEELDAFQAHYHNVVGGRSINISGANMSGSGHGIGPQITVKEAITDGEHGPIIPSKETRSIYKTVTLWERIS